VTQNLGTLEFPFWGTRSVWLQAPAGGFQELRHWARNDETWK